MEKVTQSEVLIKSIIPDPNQPRQYFDKEAMQELTDSVREKGILQPILIRPIKGKKDQYMIVCGERRYQAAKNVMVAIKDRDKIPVIIRDITDDEALELQIIENLQRKDVHPMEEAVAFESLAKKGKTNVDVAKRVGKSEFYVRQRRKLNSLSKKWQQAFHAGRIDLIEAIKIASLVPESQDELYTDEVHGDSGKISIGNWKFNQFTGALDTASFDIADPNLDKKMGACTKCPFNSACASLFPDDVTNPICRNIACFKNKRNIHFTREFKNAIDTDGMIFVNPEYGGSVQNDITAMITKAGATLVTRHNSNFEAIQPPEKPDYNDLDDDDFDSKKEKDDQHADDMKDYEKELGEFNAAGKNGKLKKAFCIHGDNAGKYIYLRLRSSNSASSSGVATSAAGMKEKEDAGKLTAADINEEIKRTNDRVKRGAELDIEKIHTETMEAVCKNSECASGSTANPKLPMQKIDRGIMIFLILKGCRMDGTTIKGVPTMPGGKYKWHYDYFEQLSKISEQALANLIRVAAKRMWGNNNMQHGTHVEDTAIRIMGEYLKVGIDKIEKAQGEVTKRRTDKADAKVKGLREKLKELSKPVVKEKPAAAPAGKKVVAKKSAPVKKAAPKKKAAKKKAAKKK